MADFLFYEMVETILALCHDKRIFNDYPNIGAFYDRFRALPTLSAYLVSEKYLNTPFAPPSVLKADLQIPQ